jgi:hypothetical protein
MVTSNDLLRRLDALESEGAIRRLMSEYQEARDFGTGNGTRIAHLFTLAASGTVSAGSRRCWAFTRVVKPSSGGSRHSCLSPPTS